MRARPPGNSFSAAGEVSHHPVLTSLSDGMGVNSPDLELPKFSPEELLGLTFLHETVDGEKLRAKVTRKIMDRDAENHQNIKFLVSCGEGILLGSS